MPLYDYECEGKDGRHEFEARTGFDIREIPCPTCGAVARRKEIQKVAGVIFTGGGWTRSGA